VREAKAQEIVDGIAEHANRYEHFNFVTISMFSYPINNFFCLCLSHLFRRQRDNAPRALAELGGDIMALFKGNHPRPPPPTPDASSDA